jgi:hypothetical protein
MSTTADGFATTYRIARRNFVGAAMAAGLHVASHVHPRVGIEGEELAMDVVIDGPLDADKMLVLSSACHGVEGYCGSGVQVAALGNAQWRAKAHAAGVAVMYIHALNPFGFSFKRRTTHENVDLNRNFHDFSKPLPVNADYRDLHNLLLPEVWPPNAANQADIEAYMAKHGMTAFQAAVTRGQHDYADGMFFGGTEPTWSNLTVRKILKDHAASVRRLAWIDVHTGLGPSGLGERIFADKDDAKALARARKWWGQTGYPVTSVYEGSSTSAVLTGMLFHAAYDECPQAQYTGIAMEYGTVPVLETMGAIRADNWLNQHPDAPAELAEAIRQQVLNAFFTDTPEWKAQIVDQAMGAMREAVDGLTAS